MKGLPKAGRGDVAEKLLVGRPCFFLKQASGKAREKWLPAFPPFPPLQASLGVFIKSCYENS